MQEADNIASEIRRQAETRTFEEAVDQLEQAGDNLDQHELEGMAEPKPSGSQDQGYRHD